MIACGISAGQGLITTIAGTDWLFPSLSLPALDAPLGGIGDLKTDAAGNVFVISQDFVFRLSRDGILTVVAGTGFQRTSGDGGPATSASVIASSLAVDMAGNLYIAGGFFGRGLIRKVDRAGIITTIAGTGQSGFSGDGGPASIATFSVSDIATDGAGNLYIADSRNQRIRRIATGGLITTVAGNGTRGFSGDNGPAVSATLSAPSGVATDAHGNLYILDFGNRRIRKVSPQGNIATIATFGSYYNRGLAVDQAGNVYLNETEPIRIRRIAPDGAATTVAGNGRQGPVRSGPALDSPITSSGPIAVDRDGNVFIGLFYANEGNGGAIARITSAGTVDQITGNGQFRFSGDGQPATSGHLSEPFGVAAAADGTVYIADRSNHRIRRVDPRGIITTFASNAGLTEAIAVDAAGNVYFMIPGLGLRRGTPGGIVTTVPNVFGRGLALDSRGNIYVTSGHQVQQFSPQGVSSQTPVVGGPQGFSGDGGRANHASLNNPTGLAFDTAGNLYIADSGNNRIRRVSPQGIITTVAGNGRREFSGDGGAAVAAGLNLSPDASFPRYFNGLATDLLGNLYIADTYNSRVRRVTPAGVISTVIGNNTASGIFTVGGDGSPALEASLLTPTGLAFDLAGAMYIADADANRVRKVLAQAPSFQVSSTTISFSASANGIVPPTQSIGVLSAIPGIRFVVNVGTTNGGNWLRVNPLGSATPRAIELVADPSNLAPGTYHGSVVLTAPSATPTSHSVAVTFIVGPPIPPRLDLDLQNLTFTFPRSGLRRTQILTARNEGSGTFSLTLSVTTVSGGSWLTVEPATTEVGARAPSRIRVTADPSGLSPGTYSGTIRVMSPTDTKSLPVVMTISTVDQAILLSQTGLSFTAVARGGIVPPQVFGVLNIGTGVANWRTTTTTLSGGSDWLDVSPSQGATDASAPIVPTAEVRVNAAGLQPGRYYGLVRVDAPGAANTPQVLTVFLEVLPADATPPAVLQPSAVALATPVGTEAGSQEVRIYNLTAAPVSFQSNVTFAEAGQGFFLDWLPRTATILPDRPARLVLQPINVSQLPAGQRSVRLPLQFSDGTVREIAVSLVIGAPAGVPRPATFGQRGADGCAPSKLLPAIIALGQGARVPAGWPAAIAVDVKDDCGSAFQSGSVVATFSNGDPPVTLQSLKDGRWHGTWQSRPAARGAVSVNILAHDSATQLRGSIEVAADVSTAQEPPSISAEGIASAAKPISHVPLAPGGMISIYGSRLTEGPPSAATATPLPETLSGTQVFMAGLRLPLFYAAENQINAVIPYNITVDTLHQILIRRGNTYSRPVPVNVANTQPAMFPNQPAGGDQILAVVVRPTGTSTTSFLNTPSARARSGDTLVIYCTGLGMVQASFVAGQASPGNPPTQTRTPVRVRIGGIDAPVLFAGLTPGFVGLYQLNVTVPRNIAGDRVPVQLEAAGQIAPPATLAIE